VNRNVMIPSAILWLFSFGIGLLIVRVSLRNPETTPKQRRMGFVLGAVACLWLLGNGIVSWSFSGWGGVYDSPPLTGSTLASGEGTWGLVTGTISPKSEIVDSGRGYVAYLEWSGIGQSRNVQFSRFCRELVLELEDGTEILFDQGIKNMSGDENWGQDDSYTFLKVGDELWVPGFFQSFDGRIVGDGEYFFRGSKEELRDSWLRQYGILSGYGLKLFGTLSLLSALVLIGLFLRAPKGTKP
jgi:hypothetical protein